MAFSFSGLHRLAACHLISQSGVTCFVNAHDSVSTTLPMGRYSCGTYPYQGHRCYLVITSDVTVPESVALGLPDDWSFLLSYQTPYRVCILT